MAQATNAADRAHWDAQERVLASPDLFQDWFGAELMHADSQLELPPQPRDVQTAEDLATQPVAYLYMLAIDGGQKPHVRLAAMDAISNRYLAAQDDYVRRIALEMLEAA